SALLVVAAFPIVAMNSIVVPAAATVRLVPRGSISASPWGIGTSFGALPALLVSVATAALLGIGAFRLGGRLPLRRARGRVIRWPTGWPSPWRDKPPPVPVALFLATRLPIGENPILLSAVPWLLAALGAAWFTSPIDEPERLQGQALMVAAVALLILVAVPAGPITAGIAGATALMPIAVARGRVPGRLRPAFSIMLLLAAAVAGGLAVRSSVRRPFSVDDLSFDTSGPVL